MKNNFIIENFFLMRQKLSMYWYDLSVKLRKIPCPFPGESKAQNRIHFIYFACANDFQYLFASLKSLERLKFESSGSVYIYIDRKDPLNQDQLNKLKTEFKMSFIIRSTKYDFAAGLGVWVILSELAAFREVAAEIGLNDYVAKVDADVLFVSERAFLEVSKSSHEAIGDLSVRINAPRAPHFMQGGCYFIKCAQVVEILRYPVSRIIHEVTNDVRISDWPNCTLVRCPEDRVISKLIQKSGHKINYTDLFYWNDIKDYAVSAYHFSSWYGLKREKMLEAWKLIQSLDNQRQDIIKN